MTRAGTFLAAGVAATLVVVLVAGRNGADAPAPTPPPPPVAHVDDHADDDADADGPRHDEHAHGDDDPMSEHATYDGPEPPPGMERSADEVLAATFAERWFTHDHATPEQQRRAGWWPLSTDRARAALDLTDDQYASVSGLRSVRGESATATVASTHPLLQERRAARYAVEVTQVATYDPDGDGTVDSTVTYHRSVIVDVVDPDGAGRWRVDRVEPVS